MQSRAIEQKGQKEIYKGEKVLKISLKEEALRTLKKYTKRIKNKISVYGEADDEGLNFLEYKFEDLIMKIDQQIEDLFLFKLVIHLSVIYISL